MVTAMDKRSLIPVLRNISKAVDDGAQLGDVLVPEPEFSEAERPQSLSDAADIHAVGTGTVTTVDAGVVSVAASHSISRRGEDARLITSRVATVGEDVPRYQRVATAGVDVAGVGPASVQVTVLGAAARVTQDSVQTELVSSGASSGAVASSGVSLASMSPDNIRDAVAALRSDLIQLRQELASLRHSVYSTMEIVRSTRTALNRFAVYTD